MKEAGEPDGQLPSVHLRAAVNGATVAQSARGEGRPERARVHREGRLGWATEPCSPAYLLRGGHRTKCAAEEEEVMGPTQRGLLGNPLKVASRGRERES